jgi:hypothetical protein
MHAARLNDGADAARLGRHVAHDKTHVSFTTPAAAWPCVQSMHEGCVHAQACRLLKATSLACCSWNELRRLSWRRWRRRHSLHPGAPRRGWRRRRPIPSPRRQRTPCARPRASSPPPHGASICAHRRERHVNAVVRQPVHPSVHDECTQSVPPRANMHGRPARRTPQNRCLRERSSAPARRQSAAVRRRTKPTCNPTREHARGSARQ